MLPSLSRTTSGIGAGAATEADGDAVAGVSWAEAAAANDMQNGISDKEVHETQRIFMAGTLTTARAPFNGFLQRP